MASRLNRGEIGTYAFAPPDKRRPVLVLTRQEVIGYLWFPLALAGAFEASVSTRSPA